MKRPLTPAAKMDSECIVLGIEKLKDARSLFALAKCPRAVAAVSRAIKSAEGAQRHLVRRLKR